VPDFSGFVEFFRRIIGNLKEKKKTMLTWNIYTGYCGYIDLMFYCFNAWLITVYRQTDRQRFRVLNGTLQHEHVSRSRNMTPNIVKLSSIRRQLHASAVLFLEGIVPQYIQRIEDSVGSE
jgi:hypothetical protein